MNINTAREPKSYTVATKLCTFEYLLLTDFAKQLRMTKSELIRKMARYVLEQNQTFGKETANGL